jgi:acyl-CoA reductase-like NAD-dependent aldehyde dehydrogenase
MGIQLAAKHDLLHIKEYIVDKLDETELLLAPAKTYIRYEPLGVTGIFGAWNYPLLTVFKPLVTCITAGNPAIMKPSEMSPASSAIIKKFVERYMDTDFFVVVEGGIDVAVELNKLPLDLICFTGSTMVGKIIA